MSCISWNCNETIRNCTDTIKASVIFPAPVQENLPCWKCWPLSWYPIPEDDYVSEIIGEIPNDKLPPFDLKVLHLPYGTFWEITVWNNTGTPERMEYMYTQNISYSVVNWVEVPYISNSPWKTWIITIVKRWRHPAWSFYGKDGKWKKTVQAIPEWSSIPREYTADYNNCEFMYKHKSWSRVSMDITSQILRTFAQFTCCRPATNTSLWITAVTWPIDDPLFPIAVWINDFVNCKNSNWTDNRGILRFLSKCVPFWMEWAVSWNDYAFQSHPWIADITDVRIEHCDWNITTSIKYNWDTYATAMNAYQRAWKNIYGSVKLSVNNENSIAHANNHYGNTESAWLFLMREIKQLTYPIPSDILRKWSPLTNCWNTPSTVITDFDISDETVMGISYLSNPSSCLDISLKNRPISLNKYDMARPDNPWSVLLSELPCNCISIAVGDNDWRLKRPYINLYAEFVWGEYSDPYNVFTWETELYFFYWVTNFDEETKPVNCNIWEGQYYWYKKNFDTLTVKSWNVYTRVVAPYTGKYFVQMHARLLIQDNNRPYWIMRWRVKVKETNGNIYFTTIWDKRHYSNERWLKELAWLTSVWWWQSFPLNSEWNMDDVFLQSTWDLFLNKWDEVYITVDTDVWVDDIPYKLYRHRLELNYDDDIRYNFHQSI
jgi:hypothetical protein